MPNLVGSRLGQYELVALLGDGRMPSVYQAQHVNTGQDVALKLIKPELGEREEFVKRFKREAKTIAGLHRPHPIGKRI